MSASVEHETIEHSPRLHQKKAENAKHLGVMTNVAGKQDSIFVPSIADGLHVDSNHGQTAIRTLYDEFIRQLSLADSKKTDAKLIIEPTGRGLGYNQLNQMVQRLIKLFEGAGGSNNAKPAAVFMSPGAARIAVLLALNAVGLPFASLDVLHTKDQRSYIVEHSQAQMIITDHTNIVQLKQEMEQAKNKIRILEIEEDCNNQQFNQIDEQLKQNCRKVSGKEGQNERVCLILYTSGSTGAPKGVMLTNANLLNRLRWQWTELPFSGNGSDVCLAKTNQLFVDSYTEILGAVLQLQRLVIVDPKAWKKTKSAKNVASLMADSIFNHQVTRLILVPSFLRAMLDLPDASSRLASLRLVVSSGEALPLDLARYFFHTLADSPSQPRLANLYGSTEVTGDISAVVFASEADAEAHSVDGFVTLGRPIFNTTIYVFKEDLPSPVGIGEIGNIFVSGDNICKGFVGETRRIVDRFTEKPRQFSNIGNGNRLISMGDIGRMLPNGELVYCGRSDSLVKIRGNRVSTLQVEQAIKNLQKKAMELRPPNVGASEARSPLCRVVAVEHKNSATFRLAAFYENWPEALELLRPDNVRHALSEKLPLYGVPELIFPLDLGTFPLQAHTGKTDQRALKQIAEESLAKAAVEAEKALSQVASLVKNDKNDKATALEIVRRVTAYMLGIDIGKVVMDATFFNQGGNSLSVVGVIANLQRIGYNNASAEMLLAEDNTLAKFAKELCKSPEKLDDAKNNRPGWIEFRSVNELAPGETEHAQDLASCMFTLLEPLEVFLDLRPNGLLKHNMLATWKLYTKSGPVSFVAFDRRRSGPNSLVGGCYCFDVTEREDEDAWKGIEAIKYIQEAGDVAAVRKLKEKYHIAEIPPGMILLCRYLFVEGDLPDDLRTAVFLAIEYELIDRARKAGYKVILTENTTRVTELYERDILGYTELFSVKGKTFVAPDGSVPFSKAPGDYKLIVMALDL